MDQETKDNTPKPTVVTNLFLSKEEFVRRRNKEKEIKARLAVEQERIENELETAEQPVSAVDEAADEVITVEKRRGRPRKD